MDRRTFLAASGAAAFASVLPAAPPSAAFRTRWIVRGSEGYDALSFLSPLSGDPFYRKYYEAEVAAFAPRLDPAALASIVALKSRAAAEKVLLSPFLDVVFSGGDHSSLGALVGALDEAETRLRPSYAASPYWTDDAWRRFSRDASRLRSILVAMDEAGFPAFRRKLLAGRLERRIAELQAELSKFDVVAEVERFTGRRLEPSVEVALLHFCKPHGIKVQGQQFLSAIDWADRIVIRTAGHELLHPPVDRSGPAWKAAMAVLSKDPLLARIVAEHDPAFGYNDLDGLADEDLASALDQIIGERLGVARDPAERWTKVDGGMHVLSAAFYGLMHRDGFAGTGGDLDAWLYAKAKQGWLAPPLLHGAAAQVLKRPVSRLWTSPRG
ncbi:MAG TPA: hypothetical protein VE891_04550 [Allosphingosinicella sp.]|nr:hypothetical protein [Allosphingosinicella sp.]